MKKIMTTILLGCALIGVRAETITNEFFNEKYNLCWSNEFVVTHFYKNETEWFALTNRFGIGDFYVDKGVFTQWAFYNEMMYSESKQSKNSFWHSDNPSSSGSGDIFVGFKDPETEDFVYRCDLARDVRPRLDAVYRVLPKNLSKMVNIADDHNWDNGYDMIVGPTCGLDADALKYCDGVLEYGDTFDNQSARYYSPSPTWSDKISATSRPVFIRRFEVVFPKSDDYDEDGNRYVDYTEDVSFDVSLWIKQDRGGSYYLASSTVDCRESPGYYRKLKIADITVSPSQTGYYYWSSYITSVQVCLIYQLDECLPPGKYYYEYEYNSKRTLEERSYSDNDEGGIFYVMEPSWSVRVKPSAADITKGNLTLHWRLDVPEEQMSDEESDTALNESSCRFNIWRKTGKDYEDFANSELVAANQYYTYWVDPEFGKLKGTYPVRYWVQVLTNNLISSERPVKAPEAYCDTRRRFGLAIGLSKYSSAAYPNGKPEELGGFVNDTKKFVDLLKKSGGVVDPDNDIIELYNDSATMQGISDALANLPMKGEKERFVPGDIAFLWIASHGLGYPSDSVGGICAYDGEYQHSGAESFVNKVDGSGVKKRNTYMTDLSWVDDYQGVRVIGILPFCCAEKMTREFDNKDNVAWIMNTRKDEQSTLNNECTQFGKFFLEHGWSEGIAYRERLQYASSFVEDYFRLPTIGNDDGKLTFLELARYAQSLTIGRSSRDENETETKLDATWEPVGNPSHVNVIQSAILDSVTVKEIESIETGRQVPKLHLKAETESSGVIRICYDKRYNYYNSDWALDRRDADQVILWYRSISQTSDADEWKWVSVSAMEKQDGSLGLVEFEWYDGAFYFGSDSEVQFNEIGTVLPNTLYEFRLQGINEYGYGMMSDPVTAMTGSQTCSAKEKLADAISASGILQYAASELVDEVESLLHIGVSRSNSGYTISFHIGMGPVVSAFVADINEDGTLTVDAFGNTTTHSITGLKLSLDGAEGFVDGERFSAGIVVDKQDWPDDTIVLVGEDYESDAVETSISGDVVYASKNLPRGLSIDSATGVISGTPTVPGSYVVKVTVMSKADKSQTETVEVPIVIGNYVDETIAVEDANGPYVPGEAVEEVFADGASWKVSGLPTGLKWDAKLPGVTGTPTKPGTNTVYFTWTEKVSATSNVNHKASSTFIVGPLPTVKVVMVDGAMETIASTGVAPGKVTGGGAYLANKSVTLKATANKGYVFAGWYPVSEGRGEDAASTYLSLAPSYMMTMPAKDVTLYAKFIAQTDDVAVVSMKLPEEMTNGETIENVAVDVSGCSSLPTVKVTGLPTGLKFTSKLVTTKKTTGSGKNKVTTLITNALPNTIYGTPTKSGVYTIVAAVTTAGKKTASCSQTVVVRKAGENVVKAEVVLIDAIGTIASMGAVPGKVTGMGVYAVGKKVMLKATANKGYVFAGWYPVDAIVSNASTCFSRSASYTIDKMPANDVEFVSAFITSECDKSNISSTVNGMVLEPWVSKTETCAFETNIWTGVYLEWPVEASALSETTVKVAGLPSGLKFTAKDVTQKIGTGKTAQTVVVVPANTIYGAPSAASKTTKDKKTGVATVTPSQVKVTVTTAGKSSQTYQIDTTVDPLPERVVGAFFGGSTNEPVGSANLTVAATGKLSGKMISEGKTWTFAANYFDAYDAGNDVFLATLTAKSGKDAETMPLAVSAGGYVETESFGAWWSSWKAEPWKTEAKGIARRAPVVYEVDGGKVTLTFGANGTAKATGEFAGVDGKGKSFVYKPSANITLTPTESGYLAFVYFAPNAAKGFAGYVQCVEIAAE